MQVRRLDEIVLDVRLSVSNVCPKLAHKVGPVNTPVNPVASTLNYSQVVSIPAKKPSTFSCRTRQRNKYFVTEHPTTSTVEAHV